MNRTTAAALLAAFASAGCQGTQSSREAVRNAPPPQSTDVYPFGIQSAGRELELPFSSDDEAVPTAAYPIFITKEAILVGIPPHRILTLPEPSERSRSGLGASNKDSEFGGYIPPLAREMARRTCDVSGKVEPIAIVHVDRSMQYRVLLEVLFTVSELGYKELFIATRLALQPDGRRAWRGVQVRARRTADYRVVVGKSGLRLRNKDEVEYGKDCRPLSPQPTFDHPSKDLALGDLQRCVESLAGVEGTVHLAVDGGMPVQAIMPLLNAFGRTRAVTPAFPAPSLRTPPEAPAEASGAKTRPPTVGDVSSVIGGLRAAFSECFIRELNDRRGSSGTVALTLRVDAMGSVADASVEVSGSLQTTGECVRSVAASAHFAPPDGGSAVIRVPITFKPRDQVFHGILPCVSPVNL